MLGRLDAADADLTEAIRLEPKRAGLLAVRGLVRGKLGRREPAIADWEKAISMEPSLGETLRPDLELLREGKPVTDNLIKSAPPPAREPAESDSLVRDDDGWVLYAETGNSGGVEFILLCTGSFTVEEDAGTLLLKKNQATMKMSRNRGFLTIVDSGGGIKMNALPEGWRRNVVSECRAYLQRNAGSTIKGWIKEAIKTYPSKDLEALLKNE